MNIHQHQQVFPNSIIMKVTVLSHSKHYLLSLHLLSLCCICSPWPTFCSINYPFFLQYTWLNSSFMHRHCILFMLIFRKKKKKKKENKKPRFFVVVRKSSNNSNFICNLLETNMASQFGVDRIQSEKNILKQLVK